MHEYKVKKNVGVVFIILALLWLTYEAYFGGSTIIEDDVPLGSTKISATYYLNTSSNHNENEVSYTLCEKIGNGSIDTNDGMNFDMLDVSKLNFIPPSYELKSMESIEWYRVEYSLGKYRVIGKIVNKADYVFSSLSELKKSTVEEGAIVATKGYYNELDGGEGNYLIKKGVTECDGIFSYKLSNGLCAELQYNDLDVLNVATVGIFPGEPISEKLNLVLNKVQGEVETISFNSGNYYIDYTLYLPSFEYLGTGKTNLIVDQRYKGGLDIIRNREYGQGYDYYFKGISFVCYTSKNDSLGTSERTLLSLKLISKCTMEGCTFIASANSIEGQSAPVDLVWFKSTNLIKNIVIKDCKFKNETYKKTSDLVNSRLVGGCLWFSGKSNTDNFDNIKIIKCEFETNCSDEIIAAWKGNYNNFELNDCKFTNYLKSNDVGISLYNGAFTNTVVQKCEFNINSISRDFIRLANISNRSDIIIDKSIFNINNNCDDLYEKNHFIFYINTNLSSDKKLLSVNIKDCSFNTTDKTRYKALIGVRDFSATCDISIKNSNFSSAFLYGVLDAANAKKISCTMENSKMTGNTYMTKMQDCKDMDINIGDNVILGSFKNIISKQVDAVYVFSGNTFKNKESALVYASKIQSSSNLRIENSNNIFEKSKPDFIEYDTNESMKKVVLKTN